MNTRRPPAARHWVGEFEHAAQLLRRPEIRDHLGEQDQLIVPPQIIHGREDVTLDDAHVERFPFGVGANHVGELRGHLHHVDRVATPCQGQGVAARSCADIEHPIRRGIGCFGRQRPHASIRFGTEQWRLAGADPILVGALDRPPLGLDVVVQDRADGSVERDDDVRTRGGRVGLCQLALEHRPDMSKLFGREPSAHTGKEGVTHRHVLVDHARARRAA